MRAKELFVSELGINVRPYWFAEEPAPTCRPGCDVLIRQGFAKEVFYASAANQYAVTEEIIREKIGNGFYGIFDHVTNTVVEISKIELTVNGKWAE